jgi:hypothetical protein
MTHEGVMATSSTVYQGGMVAIVAASGLLNRGGTASSVTVGRSKQTVVSAAAGKKIEFETGIFLWTNDGTNPITAAMRGKLCYAVDDQTVSHLETQPVAGVVYDVDSRGVWVKMDFPSNIEAIAT